MSDLFPSQNDPNDIPVKCLYCDTITFDDNAICEHCTFIINNERDLEDFAWLDSNDNEEEEGEM